LIEEWLGHTVIVAMHLLSWPSIYPCAEVRKCKNELITEGNRNWTNGERVTDFSIAFMNDPNTEIKYMNPWS
jgi:hypothetical protein